PADMGIWDTVSKEASSLWDSASSEVTSIAHQGWDFFVEPAKWEKEHMGTEGGLAPTVAPPIKQDLPSPTLSPPASAGQAVPEKGTPSPSKDLSWEDKQQLAKGGFLKKDEERMYGVNNWKNPVRY